MNNYWLNNEGEIVSNPNLNFSMSNSIVSGSEAIELLIEQYDESDLNFMFKNCMIKFDDINDNFSNESNFDFTNTDKYQSLYYQVFFFYHKTK